MQSKKDKQIWKPCWRVQDGHLEEQETEKLRSLHFIRHSNCESGFQAASNPLAKIHQRSAQIAGEHTDCASQGEDNF